MAARGGRRIAAFDFLSPGERKGEETSAVGTATAGEMARALGVWNAGRYGSSWLESDRQTHGGEDRHAV